MLLAVAHNERTEAQALLADLRYRIGQNARVQEGGRPAEDPQVLLDRALEVSDRIRALGVAIDVTHVGATLPDGDTLVEAIARRDALDQQIRVLAEAADRASDRIARSGRAEIRELPMFDVGGLREEVERLTTERRALDVQVQRTTWTTQLHVPV